MNFLGIHVLQVQGRWPEKSSCRAKKKPRNEEFCFFWSLGIVGHWLYSTQPKNSELSPGQEDQWEMRAAWPVTGRATSSLPAALIFLSLNTHWAASLVLCMLWNLALGFWLRMFLRRYVQPRAAGQEGQLPLHYLWDNVTDGQKPQTHRIKS